LFHAWQQAQGEYYGRDSIVADGRSSHRDFDSLSSLLAAGCVRIVIPAQAGMVRIDPAEVRARHGVDPKQVGVPSLLPAWLHHSCCNQLSS
jgi:hypothetical protein